MILELDREKTMGVFPYSGYVIGGGEAERFVEVREARFHGLLRELLSQVVVDESWYKQVYGDVAYAIEAGSIKSAAEHYRSVGYFENRFPREIVADEMWYFSQYSDVAAAVREGKFSSAQDHFVKRGFQEGRLPHLGWSL